MLSTKEARERLKEEFKAYVEKSKREDPMTISIAEIKIVIPKSVDLLDVIAQITGFAEEAKPEQRV